jgi:hypothetical protein
MRAYIPTPVPFAIKVALVSETIEMATIQDNADFTVPPWILSSLTPTAKSMGVAIARSGL